MIDFVRKETYGLNDLKNIVALLRGPGGCPWDAEQTHEGIRRDLLEECYEVVEAINQKNSEHLQEELGDVLLQVVFLSQLEQEAGRSELQRIVRLLERRSRRRQRIGVGLGAAVGLTGLWQIIADAQLFRVRLHPLPAEGGNDNDLGPLTLLLPQSLEQAQPVQARQGHVHQ